MLIGLGLGPGDPELLTLKAVRILEESDKVFVPGKLALDLVLPYTDAHAQTGRIRVDRRSQLLLDVYPPEKADTGKIPAPRHRNRPGNQFNHGIRIENRCRHRSFVCGQRWLAYRHKDRVKDAKTKKNQGQSDRGGLHKFYLC